MLLQLCLAWPLSVPCQLCQCTALQAMADLGREVILMCMRKLHNHIKMVFGRTSQAGWELL